MSLKSANHRFEAGVDREHSMIRKSGLRFPACAKPLHGSSIRLEASAGEGWSEKIMRNE
jgi:hypothetical protein